MKLKPEVLKVIRKAVDVCNGPRPEVIEGILLYSGVVKTQEEAAKAVECWAENYPD